jgi:hypothetical protein
MLEVLGLTALEEIGLLGVIGADIVMPELLIAEAAILAGVFIVRAIRKHKREKEEEENKPI